MLLMIPRAVPSDTSRCRGTIVTRLPMRTFVWFPPSVMREAGVNADSPIGWISGRDERIYDSAPVFDTHVVHDMRCACYRAGHNGAAPTVQLDIWDFIEPEE